MTQKSLANLNEIKVETMRGMQGHKITPPHFRDTAQEGIDAIQEAADVADDMSQSQR